MRVSRIACVLGGLLIAAPVLGQTQPPQQQKPPAQTPPAAQQPATPQRPPRPFPEGSRIAIVSINRIIAESAEGKASTKRLQDLQQKKIAEIGDLNKQLTANQEKVRTSASLMKEDALAALNKEIERQTVDLQRKQQDAQAELQDLERELQADFERKLMPVIEAFCLEKNLLMLFGDQAGYVWADSGLDVTLEIVKRFDATGAKPAGK